LVFLVDDAKKGVGAKGYGSSKRGWPSVGGIGQAREKPFWKGAGIRGGWLKDWVWCPVSAYLAQALQSARKKRPLAVAGPTQVGEGVKKKMGAYLLDVA